MFKVQTLRVFLHLEFDQTGTAAAIEYFIFYFFKSRCGSGSNGIEKEIGHLAYKNKAGRVTHGHLHGLPGQHEEVVSSIQRAAAFTNNLENHREFIHNTLQPCQDSLIKLVYYILFTIYAQTIA
jgi:hypothetical protein